MSDILGLIIDNKLIAILITMFGTFYWLINRIRTELNDKKKEFMDKVLVTDTSVQSFKSEIEDKLNQSPNLYKRELTRTLEFLDRHLETLQFFSAKAFNQHIIFSFIYSFLFFYLVWLFGANGHIGIYEFMPNENRISITFLLVFQIFIINFLLTHITKIHNILIKKLPYFSNLSITWQVYFIVFCGGVILLGGVLFVSEGLKLVGVFIITSVGIMLLRIPLEIVKTTLVLLGGFLIIVEVIVITLGNDINSNTISYPLFLLILPFVNAIFDYLSMLASRYFAQKILYKHTKKTEIFWDIFFDLLVATFLFITLAFSLYFIINFTNIYFIKEEALFIPIEHYKNLLLSWNLLHPDVLWITLMFVSTLIPTFIHLYLFVYSLMAFIVVKPHLHQVVEDLEKLDLENHHKKELLAYDLADYRLTGWLRVHNFLLSALAIGFFVVLGVLISKVGFFSF